MPKITINNLNDKKVIIVGSGPSGLFAALTLVQNGLHPIVIEQGSPVEEREKQVDLFRKTGKLNNLSNVQFGEGGSGTFSDGKLTTGIHSPFCKKVLEEFVNFGAPNSILYLSKPHIGTDKLIKIIKNMREYMISKGAKFLFNTKVIDFNINNNKISSVVCKDEYSIYDIQASHVILAIGHSSRDTFHKLYERGVCMEKKNFSVGVRIEHLQEKINKSQYGNSKLHLPPAEYKLAYHLPNGRSCYTFCMCPGGVVIASSSEENTIVTNGMSNFLRDGKNANSAVLVNVTPDDFPNSSPLAGIYFQKDLEEKAFVLGGKNYYALDDDDKDKILAKVVKGNQKPEISRFKGLGEMSAQQLKETTMDKKNRLLLQVRIPSTNTEEGKEEAFETRRQVDRLMGKNPETRFKFIIERAKFVDDLDI